LLLQAGAVCVGCTGDLVNSAAVFADHIIGARHVNCERQEIQQCSSNAQLHSVSASYTSACSVVRAHTGMQPESQISEAHYNGGCRAQRCAAAAAAQLTPPALPAYRQVTAARHGRAQAP
jgi:hypothetical protein